MSIDATLAKIPTMTVQQRKTLRANAEEKIASGDPKWVIDAPRVLEALDVHTTAEVASKVPHAQSLPKAQRVAFAFEQLPPSEAQIQGMQVLIDNPGKTNAELSTLLGWNKNGWDMLFGKMCSQRMSLLWPAEPSKERDALFFSGILAHFDSIARTFTARDEMVEGLATIGIRRRTA